MPNHIQCRLTAPKFVLDELKGDEECDFNTMVKMPEILRGDFPGKCESAAERALLDFPQVHNITKPSEELKAGNFGRLADNLHMSNMMDPEITPSPLTFDDDEWRAFITMLENKRKYGHYNWYKWSIEHWGTKWNAYSVNRVSNTVLTFQTAWKAPLPVLAVLAARHPDHKIIFEFADEDYGHNYGSIVIENNEVTQTQVDDVDAFIKDLWGISDEEWSELHEENE